MIPRKTIKKQVESCGARDHIFVTGGCLFTPSQMLLYVVYPQSTLGAIDNWHDKIGVCTVFIEDLDFYLNFVLRNMIGTHKQYLKQKAGPRELWRSRPCFL